MFGPGPVQRTTTAVAAFLLHLHCCRSQTDSEQGSAAVNPVQSLESSGPELALGLDPQSQAPAPASSLAQVQNPAGRVPLALPTVSPVFRCYDNTFDHSTTLPATLVCAPVRAPVADPVRELTRQTEPQTARSKQLAFLPLRARPGPSRSCQILLRACP